MSRITIAQLEAFHWIATLGSVEGAASKLNLSQPTVSLRLKALETAVGTQLFDRSRRALRLTPEGGEMLQEARRVLGGVTRMAEMAGPPRISGPIRVGISEGVAVACLAQVLELLNQRYPDLQPEILVATSAEIAGALSRHTLDFALLVSPTAINGFEEALLGAQESRWIAATKWNLPDRVEPRDLVDLPIMANPPNSINYSQTSAWFGSANLRPMKLAICNSVAVLAHVVGAGGAIGILPVKMMEPAIAAGRVRALTAAPRLRDLPIFAQFPTGGANPRAQAFLSTVKDVLSAMDYLRHPAASPVSGSLIE